MFKKRKKKLTEEKSKTCDLTISKKPRVLTAEGWKRRKFSRKRRSLEK